MSSQPPPSFTSSQGFTPNYHPGSGPYSMPPPPPPPGPPTFPPPPGRSQIPGSQGTELPGYGAPPVTGYQNPTFQNAPATGFQHPAPPSYQNPQVPTYQKPSVPTYQNPPVPTYQNPPVPTYQAPSRPVPTFPGSRPPPFGGPATNFQQNSGQNMPPAHFPPPPRSMEPPGQQPEMNYPPQHAAGVPMKRWPAYPAGNVGEQPGSPMTNTPTQRIDPSQIPRPNASNSVVCFDASSGVLPPPVTSNFIADEVANCSPRFMRSTLYHIPCTGEVLNSSGMPLALMVQPFALPHPEETEVQIVDNGEGGPVRCTRCKAYMNPFMKFFDQGKRFECVFCGHSNETPKYYHCNMGPDGRRRDADERPELSRGTVELVATQEFMVRPPMLPSYLFLIDVSANAIKTGATAASCSAIKNVLSDFPKGSLASVGIATFDTTIHFYNLNRKLQQPHMLVVPDIEDVYVPIEIGLMVPVSEGVEHIEKLLDDIPNMFAENPIHGSALGSAIKAAFLALKNTGGKIMVFQSVLPTVGLSALRGREAEAKGAEKEAYKVLLPADKSLGAMVSSFKGSQVCVDLFITSQAYTDVASLSVFPKSTGGQIYYYFPFSPTMDSAKLYNDLRWNILRLQGMEAVMRVRCSQGLQIQEYSGSYALRVADDVELPAIDCDKSFMVTFKYDDKFQEGALCCFQCALLYTSMNGERRIRVSTLALPCTSILGNVFKSADHDAQFTAILKTAAENVTKGPLSHAKQQAIDSAVQSLYAYRKFVATASNSGQLILPEGLKFLPLYTLALTRSVGFTPDARVDVRSYWLYRVATISPALAIPLVYPQLYAVHNLSAEHLEYNPLPPAIGSLSSEKLEPEGIYLMENGDDAFLYPGKAVSSDLLYQLFEIRSVNEVIPGQFVLQEYDNEPSRLLNKVVNEIRQQRCSYLRLHLLKRDDPMESVFHSFLIEDRSLTGPSYMEFLVNMHKKIMEKINSPS